MNILLLITILLAIAVILIFSPKRDKRQITDLNKEIQEHVTENNEKTYSVFLVSAGQYPISVIKELREITDLELLTIKKLVDNAPQMVINNLSKDMAEKVKTKLESIGATVELK